MPKTAAMAKQVEDAAEKMEVEEVGLCQAFDHFNTKVTSKTFIFGR